MVQTIVITITINFEVDWDHLQIENLYPFVIAIMAEHHQYQIQYLYLYLAC